MVWTCDDDWGEELYGDRRPRTWLESMETDMAELEINREDIHVRKKWSRNLMKRKSNPI